ncbi:MAG: DUF86 domain-containing protein [Patescibacteria group bacterium]
MLDKEIIEKKIKQIISYLNEIEPVLKLNFKDYRKDVYKIRTLERNTQLIVDNIIDINNELILGQNIEPADDYYGTFTKLKQTNIFPDKLISILAPLTGLRNRLVHEYEKVDQKILFTTMQKRIKDIKEYLKIVLHYDT